MIFLSLPKTISRYWKKISSFEFTRLRLLDADSSVMLLTSLIVGICSGVGAVLFRNLIEWMQNYRSRAQALDLPSAPEFPFTFVDDLIPDSLPNPATNLKSGMTVRVSDVNVLGNTITFNAWSENTIRGAAGGTVLLAELAVAEGLLDE